MFTLSVIFNKDMDKVLMCRHKKQRALNFIGGKVESGENELAASYRELQEETGITKDDVSLQFLRYESVTECGGGVWNMYITTGILNKDVELRMETNPLVWVPIRDVSTIIESFHPGSCYMYMMAAIKVLTRHKEGSL